MLCGAIFGAFSRYRPLNGPDEASEVYGGTGGV
jgi:hypothetical protein